MKMFDLCVGEEGKEGKKYWNKLGTLFQKEDGSMWLKLFFIPGVNIAVFEQKPRHVDQNAGSRYGNSGAGNRAKHTAGDDDQDLPF